MKIYGLTGAPVQAGNSQNKGAMENNEVILQPDEIDTNSSAFLSVFKELLIGQPQAEKIALAAFEAINNPLRDKKRPIGVYALIGPSRTGKTYTARILAKLLHMDENALTKINCGDYVNEHQLLELKGAPPSYVGYVEPATVRKLAPSDVDGTSKLSQHNLKRVRLNSSREIDIVVLDEFEKADADCYRFFMGIFDDGLTAFGNGIEGDFTNTIFILTMNLGMDKVEQLATGGIGFTSKEVVVNQSEIEDIVAREMQRRFKPEFRNRLDAVVVLKHHTIADLLAIVGTEVKLVQERILQQLPEHQQFYLEVRECAAEFLLAETRKEKEDVAALKRVVNSLLLVALGRELSKKNIRGGDRVIVTCDDGQSLSFKVVRNGGGEELLQFRRTMKAPRTGLTKGETEERDCALPPADRAPSPPPLDVRERQDQIYDLIGATATYDNARNETRILIEKLWREYDVTVIDSDVVQFPNPMFVITVYASESAINRILREYHRLQAKRR